MSDYKPLVILMNEDMLKAFSGFDKDNPESYFKAHKRAKKPPMEGLWGKTRKGLIPSVNKFLNVNDRQIQNTWEQHLKEYCEFCMKKQGFKHNYIDQCIILTIQFKPTKAKSDNNNIYSKPFIDAMVERELIKEDNYTVVQFHAEYSVVDKDIPHSEIRIYIIDEEHDFACAMYTLVNDVIELNDKYNS